MYTKAPRTISALSKHSVNSAIVSNHSVFNSHLLSGTLNTFNMFIKY